MEERIIDDEYGRGIRLKKTKDGYVDATDELAEDKNEETEAVDEVAFEFPVMETEEDDEDLVGLSPEEAMELKRKKAEELAKRKEKYERICKIGEELLSNGDYATAEKKYEKALKLDDKATDASVGYWRAKTENFTKPDVLIEEYLEAGIESLEFDLGYEAIDIVKEKYRSAFEKRLEELTEEETPLAKEVEGKQIRRRKILKERLQKGTIGFVASLIPTLVAIILTVVFGLKIPTTRESFPLIVATAVSGGVSVVAFIVFMVFANKFLNAIRMYSANEKLDSTEDGERLVEIRAYKELYEALLEKSVQKADFAESAQSDETDGISQE